MNIILPLLFFVSVFSYSQEMTDTHILPKWLYTLCALAIIVIVESFRLLKGKRTKLNERGIFAFVLVLCFCQSVYAIAQFIGLLPSPFSFQVIGSFDNPAGLSACLNTGVPCCFYFLNTDIRSKIRWIAGGCLLLIVVGLLLSGSRAGLLAAIIVSLCWGYRFLKKKYVRIIVAALSIGLLVGMYFVKKDSANGRLLMLQCGWEMIKERPITGYGTNGVAAHYMDYQAQWLSEHPDSRLCMLADNVKHVFNEYLAIGIRYGLVGIFILIGFIFLSIYSYRKSPSEEGRCAMLSLIGIAVLACFSYPFTYPFTWLVLLLDAYILFRRAFSSPVVRNNTKRCLLVTCVLIASCILLLKVVLRIDAELKWAKVAQISLTENKEDIFSGYQNLMQILGREPYFLYNYAAELYIAQHYEEALDLAKRCRIYWADYDLELLQGDIFYKLGRYEEAERHYLLASQMCPVRFIPLYKLYTLYQAKGETEKINDMGNIILSKPVKVNSIMIQSIKKQIKKDLRGNEI